MTRKPEAHSPSAFPLCLPVAWKVSFAGTGPLTLWSTEEVSKALFRRIELA